ncbi:hypothetical protein BGZ83_004307 [Gryganskiella cystojenkinii]|nr:hypothetical protein BGZ83_004307 [Gryganskiella cystojenkinii]
MEHQENLGFPWDAIRYDDQVVALLKELTLHPVTIEFPSLHHQQQLQQKQLQQREQQHQQQQQQQQQHQQSQTALPRQRHYTSSGPIDTAKIASLSISGRGFTGNSPRSPVEPSQQLYYAVQTANGEGLGNKQQQQQQYAYPFLEQAPMLTTNSRQYSHRNPSSSNAYHSAPVQFPSSSPTSSSPSSRHQEPKPIWTTDSAYHSKSHSGQVSSPSSPPLTTARSPYSSGEINVYSPHQGSTVKRKRQDVGQQVSPRSPEQGDGPSLERNHGGAQVVMDDQDRDRMVEEDEMRPHNYLKRHASAGTLRVQAAFASANYAELSNREYHPTTPSPGAKGENEGRHFRWGSSDIALQMSQASSPGSVSPNIPGSGKNTIQFSEVVEYAQLLQIQYGRRCQDHPWGCVELSREEPHLELTIKMYMDWAGLVASGRLTMDELPDLPEFKRSDSSFAVSSPPLGQAPTAAPSSQHHHDHLFTPSNPGCNGASNSNSNSNNNNNISSSAQIRRMMSSPLTTCFRSFSLSNYGGDKDDDGRENDGGNERDRPAHSSNSSNNSSKSLDFKTEEFSPELGEKDGEDMDVDDEHRDPAYS